MPSMREALENAYDELDAEPTAEAPVETAPAEAAAEPVDAEPAVEGERARDEHGKFVKQDPVAQGTPPPRAVSPAAPANAGQGAAAVATPSGAASVVAPAFKAPRSWRADVRELAAKLPPEFRPIVEESLRREKDHDAALQARAAAEKTASTFGEVVRPYEAQIRASGQEPHQYVGTLLQTAHSLFYGPSQAKPGLLADLIMQAGVPPEQLDQALVARMTGQHQPAQRPQQPYQDPRVDQLLQKLEAAQQERTSVQAAEADATANGFAESHEFFNDVAKDVADILDLWKAQGKKEVSEADLERAYELACNLNENVSTVLAGRKAATTVQTAQAATTRAKAASSTVRGQPTAAVAAQPAGRRAVLEARFDELAES